VAYLFDTDALSEAFKRRPLAAYVDWLGGIPREEQFASAVSVAEIFEGAFAAPDPRPHLRNLTERLLPAVTVLPFDVDAARVFGEVAARLRAKGLRIDDPDLQIAATALAHDLTLVTGNVKHFARVPDLRLERVLAEARAGRR
jgi:predicted nucleic acid-binding protein